MKTVRKLWFDNERIFIETAEKEVLSQPMRFFPRLRQATDDQRSEWTESHFGLHWESIDEDISFESFTWADNDPLTLYHRQ
ncbi:MAG: DUF2442 domain-containing protein [Tannerellaceae bacterium]|jgi:hypothetical protein|nr:DUF2442 domain-containing protein [Tannerellaceae bacterium]